MTDSSGDADVDVDAEVGADVDVVVADADVDADSGADGVEDAEVGVVGADVSAVVERVGVDIKRDNDDADVDSVEQLSLAGFGVQPSSRVETPIAEPATSLAAPRPRRADGGQRNQEQLTLEDATLRAGGGDGVSGEVVEARGGTESDGDCESPESMCVAYRHDVHKLFGRSHEFAQERVRGVRVNEPVPLGADGDAALLSRPAGKPGQTVKNHVSPVRLSLVTGSTPTAAEGLQLGEFHPEFTSLIEPTDPERLHAEWLTSSVAGVFCESVYYPYTSLKYHTLLVAAFLNNYRAGYQFDELSLVASPGSATAGQDVGVESALASDTVESHRTVCWTPALTLHITGEPGERPATPVGEIPARSFADVWSRLPEHPIDVDCSREARLLDAQLRRIRSWSTALQYIEDVTHGRGPLGEWGDVDE